LASIWDLCLENAASLGQDMPRYSLIPNQQTVLNLMGRSDDPIVLRGTAMNDDDFIGRVAPENVEFTLHVMYTARILLACIFCEYKTAVEIAEKSRKTVAKALPGSYMMTIHFFYDALATCALLRESGTNSRKHKKVIKATITKMKKWAANSPSNFKHKLLLLEAEYAVIKRKQSSACKAYEAAITAAHKSGMVQDEALSYERAALFQLELGDDAKALNYLTTAQQLYLVWGAEAKSSQLQKQLSVMVS